jgi:predicted amidohydrolase YtcJ
MLIRRAELEGGAIADVRIERGRITAIGSLNPHDGEVIIDARGGLLLPGLHDHHIHVAALAASLCSVACGPPHVASAEDLAAALGTPGTGWLRGTGYHESVAGPLDAAALDRLVPDRPVRVQHRSGRMWFFNSLGLAVILAHGDPPPGLERDGRGFTGRLFDEDTWLRRTLGGVPPSFAAVGAMLARAGVTGLTEISPANDAAMARHFAAEIARAALPQRVLLAGSLALAPDDMAPGLTLGPAKLHLHEAELPALDAAIGFAAAAHDRGRAVAVHCATEVELLYTLAMFDEAGVRAGDRIEHASVTPDFAIPEMARLGLAVVSQPHFIAERGDAYVRDIEPATHSHLYRLRSFREAGVTLAGGSDAPFGRADPWAAMAAAVSRRTHGGVTIGASEALTPEQALDLFLRMPEALDRRRRVEHGAPADLCLLDRPWSLARADLASVSVRATFVDGRCVFDRVDQAPA